MGPARWQTLGGRLERAGADFRIPGALVERLELPGDGPLPRGKRAGRLLLPQRPQNRPGGREEGQPSVHGQVHARQICADGAQFWGPAARGLRHRHFDGHGRGGGSRPGRPQLAGQDAGAARPCLHRPHGQREPRNHQAEGHRR